MKIIYCVCADIGAGLSLQFFHCLSTGTIRSTIYKVWIQSSALVVNIGSLDALAHAQKMITH